MNDKEQKGSTKTGEGAGKTYYNAAPIAIDLSDGTMVPPSGTVEAADLPMNRHNKFLVDSGSLVLVEVTDS
jgi:hypothetical protein